MKNGDDVQTGTYKLDPSKTPNWIDVTIGGGTYLAIYELKGDTLRICHRKAGGDRPTEFVSEAASPNTVLSILKRQKN